MWGSVIEGLRVAFSSSMPFCVLKKIAQMVAVEHVLDLENTVNFDRHTSVLAPYCNCWEAPSAKSDPGSSQAASRVGRAELSNCEVGEGGLGKSRSYYSNKARSNPDKRTTHFR